MAHGHAELGESTPQSVFYDTGRFGRLFPTLPPFAADTPSMRDGLAELGAKGGPMDPDDDLSDPITLITDPAKSAISAMNASVFSGGASRCGAIRSRSATMSGLLRRRWNSSASAGSAPSSLTTIAASG